MDLKLEVTPLMAVNVKINGQDLGEFKEVSRWEGMVKLSNSQGIIIADDGEDFMENLFAGTMFANKDEPKTLTIVKISPGLVPVPEEGKVPENGQSIDVAH